MRTASLTVRQTCEDGFFRCEIIIYEGGQKYSRWPWVDTNSRAVLHNVGMVTRTMDAKLTEVVLNRQRLQRADSLTVDALMSMPKAKRGAVRRMPRESHST